MRAVFALFVVFTFAGCAGAPPEAPTLVGTWEGEAGQWDDGDRAREPDSRWPVAITLVQSASGEPNATIDYPSFPCGGRLRYVGPSTEVDARPGDVVFQEEITYGEDICFSGGTVLLRLEESSLVFAWAIDSAPTVAAGRLQRSRR